MLTDVNADMGIYASDKWTLRRLTVTGGVRFDYFNTGIPAQSAPASRWVGARSFDALYAGERVDPARADTSRRLPLVILNGTASVTTTGIFGSMRDQ